MVEHGQLDTYALTPGRHGRFLVNRNDTHVGRSLIEYGEWSEPEVALFALLVQPGDVVLEAGANLGSHTVALSRLVGATGQVLAYEPQRLTHQLLCANLALNECFNVRTRQEAVGACAGVVNVPSIPPDTVYNFGEVSLLHAGASRPHEQVPVVALDDLQLARLDLIKADIEGFEAQLLQGARQTLARHRPVVYLEFALQPPPRGNRDALIEAMQAQAYECFYFVTPMFNPHNARGNAHNMFGHGHSYDLLCVPPEKWTVQGLTQAQVGDEVFPDVGNGLVELRVLPWHGVNVRRTHENF